MGRKYRRMEIICYWCKRDVDKTCSYRTRDHHYTPEYPHVGVFVCGPGCKDRPPGTHVYAQVRQDHDG